jgi:cytochrome c5
MKKRLGVMLLSLGIFPSAFAIPCSQVVQPMTQEAILNRIKPIGSVETEDGVAEAKPMVAQALGPNAGAERYKSTCSVCHETGVAGAPKFRNAAEWKSRMDVGIDGMLKIAIQGKGGMPPRGTCMQCSDEELKATIEYMLPK